MRYYLTLVLILGITLWLSSLLGPSWEQVIPALEGATVPLIADGQMICTAFSINEIRGYYLTAAHCLSEGLPTIDGHSVQVVYRNDSMDITVLRTESFRTALPHRRKPLKAGMPTAAYGYGYGLVHPILKTSHVAIVDMPLRDVHLTILDASIIPGMSGGPVVDQWGYVAGICQLGDQHTGAFRLWSPMYEATARFWQY